MWRRSGSPDHCSGPPLGHLLCRTQATQSLKCPGRCWTLLQETLVAVGPAGAHGAWLEPGWVVGAVFLQLCTACVASGDPQHFGDGLGSVCDSLVLSLFVPPCCSWRLLWCLRRVGPYGNPFLTPCHLPFPPAPPLPQYNYFHIGVRFRPLLVLTPRTKEPFVPPVKTMAQKKRPPVTIQLLILPPAEDNPTAS